LHGKDKKLPISQSNRKGCCQAIGETVPWARQAEESMSEILGIEQSDGVLATIKAEFEACLSKS
jgi:hypothetical protein